MNYLDELLEGLNVDWKTLGDMSKIFAGGTPKTSNPDYYDGDIPWIRSGEVNFNIITSSRRNITEAGLAGSSAKLIRKNSVVLAMTGATVARSAVIEFTTSANQSVAAIETIENYLNYKYLFYYLEDNYHIIKSSAQGALTSLNLAMIKKLKIPIPYPDNPKKSLIIQQKIVAILDTFKELTIELTTELTARKQQYAYYREQLLSFDENMVEWKTLSEIAEYSKDRIGFQKLDENNYVGVDNLLQDKLGKTISSHVPTKGNSTRFQINDILIGNIRPYLKKIWLSDCVGGTNGDVLTIRLISENISPKFLYQVLADDNFFEYNMKHAKGAKMPRGNKTKIMDYLIPIPSPKEQERVVSILDKFDTITTSINEGLPKEIELRQKQYEYYRALLLDFPKPN